jgi:hypothetical protein
MNEEIQITDSGATAPEAEQIAAVTSISLRTDEERAATLERVRKHRAKKKETDKLRKRASRSKDREQIEARESATAARRAQEEASEHAEELKRERDEDIQFELTGGNRDNTPEENRQLEQKIDDYLHQFEHKPFEELYNFLSLVRPGRYILKHLGVEPLEPGTYIEPGVGIKKRARGSGRMVQATDGSWMYLTDELIEDFAQRKIQLKSSKQLEAERKAQSPELADHYHRRALKFLAETKAKEAQAYAEFKARMRELERTYLQARKINKEKACHSDKTQ